MTCRILLLLIDERPNGRHGRHLPSSFPSTHQLLRNSVDGRCADGAWKHNAGPSAKPPECLFRHLNADTKRSQRLNSFNTLEVVDERARWVLEDWDDDQNSVDVVQSRRRHLSNTPGPVKNLFDAQHDERLRLLANDAEQQAQIL